MHRKRGSRPLRSVLWQGGPVGHLLRATGTQMPGQEPVPVATCKQGVWDTHKLLGRKAILPQGPWGRGKVPTAWLMRLTARPLSRVQHAVDRSALVPGSARPRSRSAPPDRFLRAPGVQVAGSDRRCQVATIEPGLRAAPPPERRSSLCPARGPSGNLSPRSLPRRPAVSLWASH